MRHETWHFALVLAVLGALLIPQQPAQACDIPVFQYALENWEPDPYTVLVFHRGELNQDIGQSIQSLQKAAQDDERPANLEVIQVDLDRKQPPDVLEVHKRINPPTLPWIAVLMPATPETSLGQIETVWSGPPEDAHLDKLADSPVRRRLAERLAAGDSAVWILLESLNTQADKATRETLETGLAKAAERIAAAEELEGEATFSPQFSILRLSSTDPNETWLVRILKAMRRESGGDTDGPSITPIFGQGRALVVLSGEDITPEIIGQACEFITGDCSCQVKQMNPGVDLLIAANWDNLAYVQATETLLPLTGVSPGVPPGDSSAPADEPADAVSLLLLRTGLVLAFGILIVAVVGLGLRRNATSK